MSNTRKDRIARALRFFEERDYLATSPGAEYMSRGLIKSGLVLVPPGVLTTLAWALKEVAKREDEE
jgi:hypothetical protein